jgi:Holliday junction DNA helicase RuvA
VRLHTHTHVREDALALFGFVTLAEKDLFEKLITVSGVGPRLAVTILSGLPTEELVAAIVGGDAKGLTRIPGVGRKTGERLVLELREKLGPVPEEALGGRGASSATLVEQDVVSAIINLGCTRDAAEKAVRQALGNGAVREFEPLFRQALDSIQR